MQNIKIRYTCKRDNGHIFSETFTIEQIESGEVETWLAFNMVDRVNVIRDTYTTYKDEQHIEIFENDIVIKNNGSRGYSEPMLVVFDGGGFRLKPNRSIIHEDLVIHLLHSAFKVIGNKHSNPELLKQSIA